MKFKFNFHQVDSSQALTLYTQEEIEKVGRFLLTESTCQVFYRMERHDCHIKVDVNSPWGHFKATSKAENFYLAMDDAAQKLGKQFKKFKEKHQNHHKTERSKQGRLKRVNTQLEFDDSPYPSKKVS